MTLQDWIFQLWPYWIEVSVYLDVKFANINSDTLI